MTEQPYYPSLGTLIKSVFQKRRIRKSALSRVLGVTPAMITKMQNAETMSTDRLWYLSMALRHNFFADIAAQLPSDFATNAPRDTTALDRISELEKEVEKLKTEIGVWEKIGRKEF
ncbi:MULTISPECIES: hypothetical protein [unclassified Flavobacterium]|uniref:hypothetical protein n=1 Tax=unclassified Flavobacterium TaxID=196869 RepID=UPI001F12AA74|nr:MULTISPECIES: hypothetical protein [unclassified Flavobacterium]UMY64672.1 hypothetical protein MKO97_09120 [Flavobacterium sp. HJ-32-4]